MDRTFNHLLQAARDAGAWPVHVKGGDVFHWATALKMQGDNPSVMLWTSDKEAWNITSVMQDHDLIPSHVMIMGDVHPVMLTLQLDGQRTSTGTKRMKAHVKEFVKMHKAPQTFKEGECTAREVWLAYLARTRPQGCECGRPACKRFFANPQARIPYEEIEADPQHFMDLATWAKYV